MIDLAFCSEITDWLFSIGLTLGIIIGIAGTGLSIPIYILVRHVVTGKKFPPLG